MADVAVVSERIVDNVGRVVFGKRELVRNILVALLSGGHVILEDVPGVGKTMLAKSLAVSLGMVFRRIQFTPDLLPADLTGVNVFDQATGEFRFRPGPVFGNVVLADEINRASPKTQSALLEVMEEQTVTVDGEMRRVPLPFLVLATQNPIEHEGVYPLPESQLDRFMMRLSVGYPGRRHEQALLHRSPVDDPFDGLAAVCDAETLAACQRQTAAVHVDPSVDEYLLDLVEATRDHPALRVGASTRAAMDLAAGCRARALLDGRDYVQPDDVQELAPAVLAHRLVLDSAARLQVGGAEAVCRELTRRVPVP